MPVAQSRGSTKRFLTILLSGCSLIAGLSGAAKADPYIRDDVADTGVEPNPSASPMWLSPDIWVRNDPLPGWNPTPYNSASPPAWLDTTHFNPDYRSPLSGKPNYIYVRIRNRNTVSSATDRLTLYWASASTGLAWDPAKIGGSFVDNVQGGVLFGAEVTKPRKNAATATQTERDAYLAALKKIATDPAFKVMGDPRPMFAGGRSYWNTQQELHRFGPTNRHGFNGGMAWIPSVAFLPWHREFINRFEGMLQEADPKVKLLYWDWTQNPVTGSLNYSTNFMGNFGTGSPPAAVNVGAPLSPDLDAAYPTDTGQGFSGGTQVRRRLQPPGTPLAQSDATVVGRVNYASSGASANSAFSGGIESFSHNNSHVYVSSTFATNSATVANAGDQLFQPYAARDPFFFLLHAKVDELWARWQRKTGSLQNLDPATTFGTASADPNITGTMGPWNGTAVQSDGLANPLAAPELAPWTPSGGQIYAKAANDRSVVSPPFYDSAPLTIPVLQPGEEVVLEIPWYPPNPAGFGAISDPHHVCLIARIETSTASPFGMTTPETADINANTKNNNNIAWRNVSVVDSIPGAFAIVKVLLANGFKEQLRAGLKFDTKLDREPGAFFRAGGTVQVDLGRELFARWRAAGVPARNAKANADGTVTLAGPEAMLLNIPLRPGEQFPVRLKFSLNNGYRPSRPGDPLVFDIVQLGTPNDPRAIVGGQRIELHTDKIALVDKGRDWRWKAADGREAAAWTTADFADKGWNTRKMDLGWVTAPEPAMDMGGMDMGNMDHAPAYYFRKVFGVEDPALFKTLRLKLKRSDGAIAYLNGKEIYRYNVGRAGAAPAERAIDPLEAEAYFPVKVDPGLLRRGRNVLAVEVHVAKERRRDPTFDAALLANEVDTTNTPVVRTVGLTDGSLVDSAKPVKLDVGAFVPEGKVARVAVLVDGRRAGVSDAGSSSFDLGVLPLGVHRIQVAVQGADGARANRFLTLQSVKAVPPSVRIVRPGEHIEVGPGQPIDLQAEVADESGTIVKVEYYIHDSYIIGSPGRLIGTATQAPYSVRLDGLTQPHAMIVAVAYSSSGERTASTPIMALLKR